MEELYSISECAKLSGISTRTLRYYDQIGLLRPRVVDNETGYRYYGLQELDSLDFIHMLKEMGKSLDEIRDDMSTLNLSRYLGLMAQHRKQMEDELARLELTIERVKTHERVMKDVISHPLGSCYVYERKSRRRLFMPFTNKDPAEHHRFRHKIVAEYGIRDVHSCVSKVISAEDIIAERFDRYAGYFLDHVFDENMGEVYPAQTLVVTNRLCYTREAEAEWRELMAFIEKEGYRICGPAEKRVLIEKGIMDHSGAHMARFSIPVEKV